MADNFPLTPGSGRNAATDQVTYSGDPADVQLVKVVRVVGAEGSKTVDDVFASTGTSTQVADNAASVTILAANSSRKGATVYNDSSATLYLLLGSGPATLANYTVRIFSNGYYEVPAVYQGVIVGIWDTDPGDGAARVTEFT